MAHMSESSMIQSAVETAAAAAQVFEQIVTAKVTLTRFGLYNQII